MRLKPRRPARAEVSLRSVGAVAVACAGGAELVIGVYAEVTALMDMDYEVVPLDADRVDDVLVDDGDKLLYALLGDALINYERAVHHAVGEMKV